MESKIRPWVIAAGLKVIEENRGLFERLKAYDRGTTPDRSSVNRTGPPWDDAAEKALPDHGPQVGPS